MLCLSFGSQYFFLVQGEGLESRRVKKTLSIEGRECSVAFSRGETPCWRETIQKCILVQLQSCIPSSRYTLLSSLLPLLQLAIVQLVKLLHTTLL